MIDVSWRVWPHPHLAQEECNLGSPPIGRRRRRCAAGLNAATRRPTLIKERRLRSTETRAPASDEARKLSHLSESKSPNPLMSSLIRQLHPAPAGGSGIDWARSWGGNAKR
ncbi:unnamed protein product [Leptosia nina]|uniref:Uncharacterized protein n=1 Tax=Leptosia nina TaxID=320188 RepID=A0AAV1IXL9_9NEOP